MIAVIGLVIGIVLGVLLDPTVPAWLTPFLPVAVVAGLDALFGAGRAWLEGRFGTASSSPPSSGTSWWRACSSSWARSLASARP